jgi:hypothetical protein
MSWFPDPESGDEGELLALLKKKYEEGEKEAVLTILFVHLEHGLPLPPWLTTAFCDAYDRYLNFEVKSLDELFGGRRKGMQIGAARRRLEKRDEVFWRVQELRKAGRSVNRDLFNAVGKEFGISGAKADSFYYEVVAARKKLGIAQD